MTYIPLIKKLKKKPFFTPNKTGKIGDVRRGQIKNQGWFVHKGRKQLLYFHLSNISDFPMSIQSILKN